MPIWAVRKWLSSGTAPDLADIEGLNGEDASGRKTKGPVLGWRSADENTVLRSPEEIRPGMTIVAPALYGG